MSSAQNNYFIPEPSKWPIIAMLSILLLLLGSALSFNDVSVGNYMIVFGFALLAYMFHGWFSEVIGESLSGKYGEQEDNSFRQGMFWFIASEFFFFLCFFGSLYYLREIAVGWLSGEGYLAATQEFLYPAFEGAAAAWPTAGPELVGGAFESMGPTGVPLINTALLLTSGVTLTIAHHALKKENNSGLVLWMWATIALGLTFVGFQAYEYIHAYGELNLTLGTGVYGSTFYILTGFHGFHVVMGSIMLIVIALRSAKRHFTPKHHFAFEAVAWYWHFVDVVWLGLFIFVYWL